MISIVDGFNIKLDKDPNRLVYTIYSYERINLRPNEQMILKLPYIKINNFDKFWSIRLDKSLIMKGLSCLWDNLNEVNSRSCFEFLLRNTNYDVDLGAIQAIIGANKIDIIPSTELGKIYIN